MTIDRIDWHEESINDDILEDELLERAGAHIGYYIEWAYKKGFAPTNPETHDVAEYQKVVNGEVSGIQFLIENCDTKFWDVDLNEEGLKFTSFAYDTYLSNLEMILGHKPYIEKYNQRDLQNVSKYLDKVYVDYLLSKSFEFNGITDFVLTEINGYELPKDYLDFMKKHNGGEGDVGNESYMQILKLEEIETYNNDYEIFKNFPDCFAFGTDLGGNHFCYKFKTKKYFAIDSLSISLNDAYCEASSIFEFIIKWAYQDY